jgi:peptidoglycan hydrolase CwlO-like protein
MNLRTTTPVSKSLTLKWGAALVAVIIVVTASFIWVNRPVSADQYDDKIRALQADMTRFQAESNRLNAEATTLANALAQITNEKNALQAQVNLSQNQYDQLVIKIADTEKQIADNQDALGSTLASLYVDDDISPIEMLASSKDISEFLNKQEFRNSIKKELSSTINRVKDLKTQLTDQKAEVETVLSKQKAARDDLQAKEGEQATLLAQTQNDESKYQGMIAGSQKEIANAKALQAALRARANSNGGYTLVNSGSLGAYASLWSPKSCSMGGPGGWYSYGGADGNGGDGRGYGCRQCASYVAWRVAKETGVYYKWGNGGDFANGALSVKDSQGNRIYQNLGSNPQPGSLAVMWGDPGHVAWVEAVDGNQVFVSQYNWEINGQYGMYSEMWLSKNVFDQYVKI